MGPSTMTLNPEEASLPPKTLTSDPLHCSGGSGLSPSLRHGAGSIWPDNDSLRVPDTCR